MKRLVVVQLDVTIVNVALQRIGMSLAGNVTRLQWIVNAYTLVLASVILTAGAPDDRLGARRVFIGASRPRHRRRDSGAMLARGHQSRLPNRSRTQHGDQHLGRRRVGAASST